MIKKCKVAINSGFSLAEALITLTIVSLILAATLPVITKKQNVTDAMWNYVGSGTGANSSVFYGLGGSQSAIIGHNSVPDSSYGSRLVIMTPLRDTSSGSDDTLRRSLIDFYQKNATGISNIGRIAFDKYNVAIGKDALIKNTSIETAPTGGVANTAIGSSSLAKNTLGSSNTAFGFSSLQNNIDGNSNTAIGAGSLERNDSGDNNSALGLASLDRNTTGDNNTGLGYGSLYFNTTGSNNVAVGMNALAGWNETRTIKNTGDINTAIGVLSLFSNTTGSENVAVGHQSLSKNTEGIKNVGVGQDSLRDNTTGSRNTGLGDDALILNQDGENNTAIGVASLENNVGGSENIALGIGACDKIISGDGNLCIGYYAGPTSDTSKRLFIDTQRTDTPLIGGDFASRYVTFNFPDAYGPIFFGSGYDMTFTGGSDSTFRFINTGASSGRTSIGTYSSEFFTVYNNGAAVWSAGGYTSSDKRWKKNITPLKSSLENVLKLQGINYYWKKKEFPKKPFNNKRQIGLIAQDVEKMYPELIYTDSEGYKNLDYSKMTPILIEAIKELDGKVNRIGKNSLTIYDKRTKNIGKENKIGLEKILKIKVKEFTFKNSSDKRKHSGIIAQELQKFFPEAVLEGSGDGKYKSLLYIDTNEILFALVNSVKQLYTKVVNLTQRVVSIEESIKIKDKKIEHLENENKYIKNQIAILNQKMTKFESK